MPGSPQAPGINAAAIFGGNAPLLSRADPRVRPVPFPTRRPTFAEAKRVARTLLNVYAAVPPAAAPPPAAALEVRQRGPVVGLESERNCWKQGALILAGRHSDVRHRSAVLRADPFIARVQVLCICSRRSPDYSFS